MILVIIVLFLLRFSQKKAFFSFLARFKQAFIKILNTDQDGTWSGPSPGNPAGE